LLDAVALPLKHAEFPWLQRRRFIREWAHRREHRLAQPGSPLSPLALGRGWRILGVQRRRLGADQILVSSRIGLRKNGVRHAGHSYDPCCISWTRVSSAALISCGTNLSSSPPSVAICRIRLLLMCEYFSFAMR